MINSIAWKNIWRNKLRSLVVIAAVTFGILAAVFSAALMNGMVERRLRSAIELETSHIQIHNPKYLENKDLYYFINNADSLVAEIKKMPEIKSASKRLKIMAMANTSSSGTGVMVNGIVPEKEKLVTGIYNKILDSSGTYFDGVKNNPVVIGQKLAEKLKIKVKSKVILTIQATDGTMVSGAFKVAGIFETSNSMFDELNIFARFSDLARLTSFDINNAHEIAILLNDTKLSDDFALKISRQFSTLDTMTWKEIQPDLGMTVEFLNIMLYFSLIIILLALGFGIVNTMLMVVLERVKELGILMAIGMNKARIFKMIMLETIYLSLTGGIAGLIFGIVLIQIFQYSGIDVSAYGEGFSDIGYDAIIYPSIGWDFYLGTVLLVILTGIIASIYPARKALKLNPAEAVRTEI
ncbi:MAG: ABC transporter permease [Bacteroidetes bacterium HGW-Bacteroidetes-1]|jgi:ABC-type lipoprotein release transport system permease subunit|nr:MAG: ABC transporter permease [Bacteroidetes bacterium HGW-Bacteroidetes-1]